jgi:hypothetical protein
MTTDPAAAGFTEVDGLKAVPPNPVPLGMTDLLNKDDTALDSGYYVDTGEPLGSEIVSGMSVPRELSDRMDDLHRALAARLLAASGDPTEALIERYRRRGGDSLAP